jgi:hypothetical protein
MVPAIVAGAGLVNRRAQVGVAAALLVLAGAERMIDRPVTEPPSSQWTVELRGPEQVLRHAILLPLGSGQWQSWWGRASGAAVYVCARGPLTAADGLQLWLGGERLATITQEAAIGPRPQPTSVGFYRLPVERAQLERDAHAVFELRRAAGATPRPVEVCGTFAYRPTAGLEASAFFDGQSWTGPGTEKRGRYIIELRIESEPGRAMAALY